MSVQVRQPCYVNFYLSVALSLNLCEDYVNKMTYKITNLTPDNEMIILRLF